MWLWIVGAVVAWLVLFGCAALIAGVNKRDEEGR